MKGHLLALFCLLLAGTAVFGGRAAGLEATAGGVSLVDAFPGRTFSAPTAIAHAGDGRLFVVEQAGRILVLHGRGADATQHTFLDIQDRVITGGERGLLGLAFHPDYATNGFLYVNYTAQEADQLTSIIARYQVSADADAADPGSEMVLLRVPQPYNNHNGGDLHFDLQGFLVIALGDGGLGGDPQNRAQDTDTLLGKLLRIDVDGAEDGRAYAIPPDNPFVDRRGADEIWAYGLRNPWRFSFDRATGDLYVADVGQGAWEEINFRPAGAQGGENYGWRLKEGLACFNPPEDCDPGGLTDPVHVYSHDEGCSVTGGYVYRGSLPALQGAYLFADYCGEAVYSLRRDARGRWHAANRLPAPRQITTFGEDASGELYLASARTNTVYKFRQDGPRWYVPFAPRG